MTILSDVEIENLCVPSMFYPERLIPMVEPFHRDQIRSLHDDHGGVIRRLISAGLTSYGYDVSLADELKIFTDVNSTIIDPKNMDERCLIDAELHTNEDGSRYAILPPNSYMLGRTIEYFRIPRDVMILAVGKSTYARVGIAVNVTPIEPGFEGNVVIEIANQTRLPAKIYVDEGISQFVFFQGTRPCRTSYADRGGKYQGQTGVTLAKV